MPKLQFGGSSKCLSSEAVGLPVNGVYSRRCDEKLPPIEMPVDNGTVAVDMRMADDQVDDAGQRQRRGAEADASEVYTISGGNYGVDNHGHSIAELRLRPPSATSTNTNTITFLATPPASPAKILAANPPSTTASTAALTTSTSSTETVDSQAKMTPTLALRPRLGRRTSLAIDVVITATLGAWIIVIELGLVPQTKRGFYCADQSISYPFRSETITTSMILGSIAVPFWLIWLGEAIFYKPASIKETRLRKSLGSAAFWFREYFIGMVLHLFLMDAVKVLVGELRPHFLDTCKPDAAKNCTPGEFISEYTCTSDYKAYVVRDSSKSFPSGHSSISFFEAIFMVWYIHRRVPQLRSRLLVPTLQTLLLFWACFCSFSRIVDHRHHWWDVLCGSILGICFAVLTCLYLCKDFKRKPTSTPDPSLKNPDQHQSVRRLLADPCCKDEVTMSHVIVT